MTLSELKDILEASILVGNEHLDRRFDKCGASDLMSDELAGLSDGCVLLTGPQPFRRSEPRLYPESEQLFL